MIDALRKDSHGSATATSAHAFVHRYPVDEKSTFKDTQIWHAGILLEWSHGLYTTVVELAYRNGVGGYGGKSNWMEDKLAAVPKLYQAMPESMKAPWQTNKAEIRLIDMPAKSLAEFEAYLEKYSTTSGLPFAQQRFLEPQTYASAPVRLRSCTQVDLSGYLLN